MKTEFEELYSEIVHTDHFDKEKIRFWFVNKYGLAPFTLDNIIDRVDGMFQIFRYEMVNGNEQYREREIPPHTIRVITLDKEIIFDRRYSYQGEKNLELPWE